MCSHDAADQLANVKYNANSPDTTPSGWDREVAYGYDAAGNRTNLTEWLGATTNTTAYTANTDNQITGTTGTRQGLTVTGSVDPGPYSNKWYASEACETQVCRNRKSR